MVMKNRQTITLLCVIAIGLVAATSANAGLVAIHSTPNDLSDLPRLEAIYSAPNDLSGLLYAEYFTLALAPNEKITGAALTLTNIRDCIKESDSRLFINRGVSNNFAGQGKLMSNIPDWLGGKPQNFNTAIDFGALEFSDVLNACAETTPSMNQANLEFKIDPNYNDFSYDLKPAINTETRTPAYHHSP
jgi:hypothetical protein